jgi:solute carrier family 6 (neurotransmitter transporter)
MAHFFFQIGIFVVYFLDYTMGCGWWVMVLYLIQIFAVFVVRGRPYSADKVATALFPSRDCYSGLQFFFLYRCF